jgi:DNA-binding transcriptional MerR regulator
LTFPLLERLACLHMRGRLIISRFAVLTGLSSKTLRYYDEIDLLRPADVDDLTSYRYYSVTQINLAVRIRRWRELGLSLDEIRQMIDHPDRAKEVLSRHEQRLNAEIAERQQSLLHLRTCLQENPMDYRTEQLPPRQILSIRTRLQPPHYDVIPEALRDLMMHAKARGYQIDPPSFFVHDNDDQGEGSLVEVCLPVVGNVEGDGRIEVRTFEGGRAFVGRFVGPYDKTGAAYSTVVEEALRRDLRITGVTAEFYVKSVPDTPNPEAYETDIAFFLEQPPEGR